MRKLFVISRAIQQLPLLVEDAGRPQPILDAQEKELAAIDAEIKALTEGTSNGNIFVSCLNLTFCVASDPEFVAQLEKLQKKKSEAQKYVVVSQDTKLDNRVLDLRVCQTSLVVVFTS